VHHAATDRTRKTAIVRGTAAIHDSEKCKQRAYNKISFNQNEILAASWI